MEDREVMSKARKLVGHARTFFFVGGAKRHLCCKTPTFDMNSGLVFGCTP